MEAPAQQVDEFMEDENVQSSGEESEVDAIISTSEEEEAEEQVKKKTKRRRTRVRVDRNSRMCFNMLYNKKKSFTKACQHEAQKNILCS